MTNTIAPQQLVKEANAAHKLFCESWASKQAIHTGSRTRDCPA